MPTGHLHLDGFASGTIPMKKRRLLPNVIKLVTLKLLQTSITNECIPRGMHFFSQKGMTSKRIEKSAKKHYSKEGNYATL